MDATVGACVRLIERGGRRRRGTITAKVGEEVQVDPSLMQRYFHASSTPLAHDLMALIGAVQFADRALPRRHATGWMRQLHVELPVYLLDNWKSASVSEHLVGCLDYLTGDNWTFSFVARRTDAPSVQQSSLPLWSEPPAAFIPYSHGLDSYAQYRLHNETAGPGRIMCVQAATHGQASSWKTYCRRVFGEEVIALSVPVHVDCPHRSEPSFRSRPFGYYLLAAYGALLAGGAQVLIPENGQGSLGASLVPTGDPKHRSCYPGFTQRLARFLETLTHNSIEFRHPALFQTKAQVLMQLEGRGIGLRQVLAQHWSCSYDARWAHVEHKQVHCGICGNCLLRRVAETNAQASGTTPYLYADLSAATLEGAASTLPRAHRALADVARNSVRDMQRMADLAADKDAFIVRSVSADVGRWTGRASTDVKIDIGNLLDRHAEEWRTFVADCGLDSWIAKAAKGTYGY
ncbi:hypothetical protein ACX83S_23295 [Burkholderia pseudomallei]